MGFVYKKINEDSDMILDLTILYDFMGANTHFKKRDEHLIIYKNNHNRSQIDFFITKKVYKIICKKIIVKEIISFLEVMYIYIYTHTRSKT